MQLYAFCGSGCQLQQLLVAYLCLVSKSVLPIQVRHQLVVGAMHHCMTWCAAAGFGLAVWIGFSLFAAIGLGNLGQAEGGEDIY